MSPWMNFVGGTREAIFINFIILYTEVNSMLKTKMFMLLFLIMIFGCASSKHIIEPNPCTSTETIYFDGRTTLISDKLNVVALSPESNMLTSNLRNSFIVSVKNRSSQHIVFSTENIGVRYITHDDIIGSDLKIYTFEELVAIQQRSDAWMALAAGMEAVGGIMEAPRAGHTTTHGTISGYSYSPYGSTQAYGQYYGHTYDHAAEMAARRQSTDRLQANISRIAAEGEANISRLSSTILKKHTIFPGRWHGGTVQIQMPRFSEEGVLYFDVTAGNENHTFTFIVKEQKIN